MSLDEYKFDPWLHFSTTLYHKVIGLAFTLPSIRGISTANELSSGSCKRISWVSICKSEPLEPTHIVDHQVLNRKRLKNFLLRSWPIGFKILSWACFTDKPRKAPFFDLEEADLSIWGGMESVSELWGSEEKGDRATFTGTSERRVMPSTEMFLLHNENL